MNVLSTTSRTPRGRVSRLTAAMSVTCIIGFVGVSMNTRRDSGRSARSISAVSTAETNVKSSPWARPPSNASGDDLEHGEGREDADHVPVLAHQHRRVAGGEQLRVVLDRSVGADHREGWLHQLLDRAIERGLAAEGELEHLI